MRLIIRTIGHAPIAGIKVPGLRKDVIFAQVLAVDDKVRIPFDCVFLWQEDGKLRVNYQYTSPWGTFQDEEEGTHSLDAGPIVKQICEEVGPIAQGIREGGTE